MSDTGGVQKNTAYGVFVQACWAQHKRQYPDELIHKVGRWFNSNLKTMKNYAKEEDCIVI